MVWDIYNVVLNDFYLNDKYNSIDDLVVVYDDHLELTQVVTKRTEGEYELILRWSLTVDDLLSRHPIFFIHATHEGYFIPEGDNDRETIVLMIKFAQLEFAGALSKQLKNTGVSKYQFKPLDYEAIADRIHQSITFST